MAEGHGGKRKNAGRKPGSANKRTREIADKAAAKGITPLEVLLDLMGKSYQAGDDENAAKYAKEAAPYVHPRMQSIDQRTDTKLEITFVDEFPDEG